VFRRVSRLLYHRTPPEKYATAFMAAIEIASGQVAYTNAGHCPSLLVRAGGGCEWLPATGIPLGLMEEWAYTRRHVLLNPGDLLALYTDGITEAMDLSCEEFGGDRLAQVISAHRHDPLKEIARTLESEMDLFVKGEPYADDRTLVIIRRNPRVP
jgi:sigma-B regulation protein RsbU (phosphoserine phosphatase)